MEIKKIFIGGWFQRTILHLVEIYDFLNGNESPLDLNAKKLNTLRRNMAIDRLKLNVGNFEYIEIVNKENIIAKIYEDGLIVLNKDYENIKEDISELTGYYEKKLSPAINYIFSLGAPVPKELANIKTIYPYFVVLEKASRQDIFNLLEDFEQSKYFEIVENDFEIYRGDKLYIINNLNVSPGAIEKMINEQIFFREFSGQLHRYLNLHRIIWEKIAVVKEKGQIKGSEVDPFKTKIEGYNKTINLIGSRINQMGVYIGTRGSIAASDKEMDRFIKILKFKYDTLSDTLIYIKELWAMTKNYVESALDLFTAIQAKSTESTVKNLTVITSMGVGATLIGLFTEKKFPDFTWFGVLYFFILAFIGYSADKIIKYAQKKKRYKVFDVDYDKNIN